MLSSWARAFAFFSGNLILTNPQSFSVLCHLKLTAHLSGNGTVPEISWWFLFTLLKQNVDQTGYADCRTLAQRYFFSFHAWVCGKPLKYCLEYILH